VGELTAAPARDGNMLEVDVDDGGSPGTGGSSWGGSNRRRASAAITGSGVAIERRRWLIEAVEWLRWSSEKRGRRWCAQMAQGSALFIATRGCCGAGKKSTRARRLRRAVELGGDAVGFSSSRRS
jgi:hypothetical protein